MRTSSVQRWLIVLGLLATIFALPSSAGNGRVELGHPIKFTDRDWVELSFTSFLRDLQHENLVEVMLYFSGRFVDEKVRNKEKAEEILKRFFADYEGVKGRAAIRMGNFEVDIEGETATVACKLTIKCTKSTDSTVLKTSVPETVKLVKERGSWKIVYLDKLLSSIKDLRKGKEVQSLRKSQ